MKTTTASFPKALEWQQWWDYWRTRITEAQPWARFMVDATTVIQQTFVTVSRILRKKPDWDTAGWSAEEWQPVIDVVDEKLAWFRANRPRNEDVPAWAGIILDCLDGAYATLSRLAREVSQIQRKGHLLINVSPLQPGDLTSRGEEIE
jgi:hypothetical protein